MSPNKGLGLMILHYTVSRSKRRRSDESIYLCGPGSNPHIDDIYGLSLLLVLSFVLRDFSLGTQVFPSPQRSTFPNSNSTRDQVDYIDVPPLNHYLFIIYLFHVHDVTFFFTSGNSTGVLSSSPSSVSACGLCISP